MACNTYVYLLCTQRMKVISSNVLIEIPNTKDGNTLTEIVTKLHMHTFRTK